MRRIFGAIMCLVLLAGAALPAMAQGQRNRYYEREQQSRRYESQRRGNYDRGYNRSSRYNGRYQDRSFWDKHRDKLSVGIGTGAGAVIGGLAGGRKGAAIGALLGAGGSALYTYKLRNRDNRRYYRR